METLVVNKPVIKTQILPKNPVQVQFRAKGSWVEIARGLSAVDSMIGQNDFHLTKLRP